MTDLPLSPSALAEVEAALAHLPGDLRVNRYEHGGGRAWIETGSGRDLVLDLYSPSERRDAVLTVLEAAPALLHAARENERLRAERDAARDHLEDYQRDYRAVMDERCAGDEKHCSCVPHLRAELARLRAEQTSAEDALRAAGLDDDTCGLYGLARAAHDDLARLRALLTAHDIDPDQPTQE